MGIFKNKKLKDKYFGYLEGITYVLLTIVIIFTAITGPILIKMLPILFILGIVGKTVYNRPVITSIFGFLISICITYILGTYSFTYIMTYSLFCFMSILMGEVAGLYISRIAKKKSKKSERRTNIISLILIIIASVALNSYINGNMYSYFKSRNVIKDYITLNYPDSNDAEIFDGKYTYSKYNCYSFNVKNIDASDKNSYQFSVYLDNKIIDGYENSRLVSNTKKLKDKFVYIVDLSEYIDLSFKVDIKYSDLKNNITLYISKYVDEITEEELNIFAEDVNNILERTTELDEFNKINKMSISLRDSNNKTDADIYNTNFFDKNYYIDSLQIEYLDE